VQPVTGGRVGGSGGVKRRRVPGKGLERWVRKEGGEGVAWSIYDMHSVDETIVAYT